MTWREITSAALYDLKNPLLIDVRSPIEFASEKVPGAVNVPLLSDDERVEVGTIYKQNGELLARRHALRYIAQKVSAIVDRILELKGHGQPVVVYCWRGGLRSEAVASLLSIAGIGCFRLSGGFKAWRRMVVADLSDDRYPFQAVVLYGMTGTGKTEILRELELLQCQVLDLEKLANHRGSTFGAIGLGTQPSQKDFEASIWLRLRSLSPGPVFVEAESRKVGRVSLPDCILQRIRTGSAVLVRGNIDARAARLAREYAGGEADISDGLCLLENLRPFIGRKTTDQVRELVSKRCYEDAIKILLIEYYDPLYEQSVKRRGSFCLEVEGDNAASAARQIADVFCGESVPRVGAVP